MHVSQKKNRIYTCVCDKMRWPFHFLCICISPGRTCTHGRLDGRPTPTTACGLHTGKRAGRETIDRVFAVPELDGYLRFSCLSFVPFSDSICLQHTRATTHSIDRETSSAGSHGRPRGARARGYRSLSVRFALPRRGRRSGRRRATAALAWPCRSRPRYPSSRGPRGVRAGEGELCVCVTYYMANPATGYACMMMQPCTGATRDYGKKGKERPCMYVLLYARDVATDTFFFVLLIAFTVFNLLTQ